MRMQRERRNQPQPDGPQTTPGPKPAPAGRPLPGQTQTQMAAAFGHDFSKVRIFADDESAAESAQDLGAKAYTVGSDIVFNDRFYDPHGSEGRALLAHELTHVVQQDRWGAGPGGRAVSDPGDASEQEAERLSRRAVAGERVQVQAAPSAVASRGLLDWAEGAASSVGSAVGDAASSVGGAVSGVASSVGNAVSGAASAAWDGTKSAASAVGGAVVDTAKQDYADMKTMGGWVKQGEEAVGHGIDWVEDKEKAGTQWVADKAKGIPVLEQVAGAGKSFLDQQTELAGGVGRGVTGGGGGWRGWSPTPWTRPRAWRRWQSISP